MVCTYFYAFQVHRLATNQHILSLLHFCLPFGFVFIRMRSCHIEISGFCVSEIGEMRTNYKRVKNLET